jgi:hypothetical protein
MTDTDEYRNSLKHSVAEEVLDLYIFRRLGYSAARIFDRREITPDQVTVFSLVAGIFSALVFALGTWLDLVWGALFLAVANILDCADGQLARLQQSGTLVGRVWDGVADYITSVAVFIGIGFGLSDARWGLIAAAGISSGLHAAVFDYYQSAFIAMTEGNPRYLEGEFEKFRKEELRVYFELKDNMRSRLIRLYLVYLRMQMWLRAISPNVHHPDERMIRRWSFLGPTTNRSLLIVCALVGQVEVFLWTVVVGGNLWLLICYLMQWGLFAKIRAHTPAESTIPVDRRGEQPSEESS